MFWLSVCLRGHNSVLHLTFKVQYLSLDDDKVTKLGRPHCKFSSGLFTTHWHHVPLGFWGFMTVIAICCVVWNLLLQGNLCFTNASCFYIRWKRDAQGNRIQQDGKPVLEFVAIQRKDNNQWSLPGVGITFLCCLFSDYNIWIHVLLSDFHFGIIIDGYGYGYIIFEWCIIQALYFIWTHF